MFNDKKICPNQESLMKFNQLQGGGVEFELSEKQ